MIGGLEKVGILAQFCDLRCPAILYVMAIETLKKHKQRKKLKMSNTQFVVGWMCMAFEIRYKVNNQCDNYKYDQHQ